MNATMRHLAVRFWLTALSGGAFGILFLPWWQQLLGVDWLIVPAVVMTVGCFAGAGWLMNRIGLVFLQRSVGEAAAWERAGMSAESETAFGKAMAIFDSFWISPLLRHRKFQWFSGVMARFFMGRNPESSLARSRVAAHLRQFPHDAAVAEPWLENLLAHERHLPLEHEAVERISLRLQKYRRIQRLLMQFYVVNGRTDFDALQTCRRVWHTQGPLPAETVCELSRLLLGDHVLTPWALQVYLAAHETGEKTAVEGIAAAVRWLPVTEESRAHLKAAQEMLDALDRPVPEEAAIARFKPDGSTPAASQRRTPQSAATRIRPIDREAMSLGQGRLYARGIFLADQAKKWLAALPIRKALPAAAIVLIIALVAAAGWRYYQRPSSKPQPQTRHEVVEAPVISDPFTIQVAAYLQRDDAKQVVDRLIQAGLDAFWTHAASAHRSWYQVKVSHFANREAAQSYGRTLKSKGLIDDFYVANYEHARRNAAKPR